MEIWDWTCREYIGCSVSGKSNMTGFMNKKLIRRWDIERELSLRRHRTRTTKYDRLVHNSATDRRSYVLEHEKSSNHDGLVSCHSRMTRWIINASFTASERQFFCHTTPHFATAGPRQLDFGTVYLLTSGLPRHSQHFVKNWKLIYLGNLTQALCYNYVAIVVLEVTLT